LKNPNPAEDATTGKIERVKADYKPEVFFIGQIVGGSDFPTDADGLFIEASLKYGDNWKMFDKPPSI